MLRGIPRTINYVETWHRKLNHRTDIAHPNIGKFINSQQKEQENVRCKILKAEIVKFDIAERNFYKEYKLKFCLLRYYLFNENGFANSLEGIHDQISNSIKTLVKIFYYYYYLLS